MTPEGKLKKAIKEYLDSIGAFWSMIPGGAYAKIGDPDMVVCYRGRYVAIEAKTPTGVQSEWQKTRQRQIEEAGGLYVLARKLDDVKQAMASLEDD